MGCGGGEQPIETLSELTDALIALEIERIRLARAVARLDVRGVWSADGALSMAAWLRAHLKMLDEDAHDLIRAGRFFEKFPAVADAVGEGTISGGQSTLLRRSVRRTAEGLFAEQHLAVIDAIAPLDIAQTKVVCRRWRDNADAVLDPAPKPVAPAELSFGVDGNGQACGRFVLSPMGTLQFEKALGTASSFLGKDDDRPLTERRAQAWEDICGFFNANHDRAGTRVIVRMWSWSDSRMGRRSRSTAGRSMRSAPTPSYVTV